MIALLLALAVSSASPSPIVIPFADEPTREVAPNAKLLSKTVQVLRAGGHDEANYRALAARSERKRFAVGSADYSLFAGGDDAPRQALSRTGAVALLVKVAAKGTGVRPNPADADPDAVYALVTLSKTKLIVWKYYDRIPSDGLLARGMDEAISGSRQPLARFDPKFSAVGKTGLDRFMVR